MANLLQKGKALRDRLMNKAAKPQGTLQYQRKCDPNNLIDLADKARFGRTIFTRLPEQAGVSVIWGDADVLVQVGAIPAEPVEGDRVIWTNGGKVVTFELMAPLNEPAWRWSDPERTEYRLHLKEVT